MGSYLVSDDSSIAGVSDTATMKGAGAATAKRQGMRNGDGRNRASEAAMLSAPTMFQQPFILVVPQENYGDEAHWQDDLDGSLFAFLAEFEHGDPEHDLRHS